MVLPYDELMALVWTMWSIALAMTAFRVGLRWYQQRQWFADDYLLLFGFVSLTASTAVITSVLPHLYSLGQYTRASMADSHTPLPMTADEYSRRNSLSLKLMFSQMLLCRTTLWATKFSILFFFRRLVDGLPRYIKAWWACFTVVLLLYVACMATNFFKCVPLNRYWTTGCNESSDLVRATALIRFETAADVAADVLIMILPLKLLWNLQISLRQKIGLAVIFSLGTILIVFAFVRLVQVSRANALTAKDPTTFENGPLLLNTWSHIECSVSVIVASLPAFRSLLRGKIGRTQPTSYGKSEYSSEQHGSSWAGKKVKLMTKSHGTTMGLDSLGENDHETDDAWGDETRLRPAGGIQKEVAYTVMHDPRSREVL
ncbi:hypothetical protein BS50DRAFT_619355 [Corynespora cassiicola Philippines]|uniref:Rhodopsin domain-containing protein n=1 Tax=Corynespora cassiicola Philippines TaxID=1448308 RepID=A0A2T2NZ37_CORCC|nr:hypothetical protein BS50DRAFT_619355 [Corynespora cassiicola Philippines]